MEQDPEELLTMSQPLPPTAPLAPPKVKSPLATWSLVLGIVAAVCAVTPTGAFVAWLPAATAIVLGIIALLRKRPRRGRALAGVIVAAVAWLVAIIVAIVAIVTGVSGGLPSAAPATSESPTKSAAPSPSSVPTAPESQETETAAPTPTEEPEEATPSAAATEDAPAEPRVSYEKISARQLALIAKKPDSHIGDTVILYGEIHQFDNATGECQFLIHVANKEQENSYDYELNALAGTADDSSCDILDDIVEGDFVKMNAMVVGSTSYDTQIGGNTTVPTFLIDKIKRIHSPEY
jgi:hypothetical protein